jgi:peptidoglycan/xylan/chitin deacetylase (PgdA/CDA1 family)
MSEAPTIEVVVCERLAQARNGALAECDADVIAYLDPDIEVTDGWFDALQQAWAAAPRRVACIGGPIGLGFPEGRPEWLEDGLLVAFGPLDYGDDPLELDPQNRTLMGGNISFRTAALRGVGGFWPARGDERQLDWFSEEHHAQRELGRVGWTARYAPSVGAIRSVGAVRMRDVLGRRLRYGARLALVGQGRPRGSALREAARAASGIPVALGRGQTAVAAGRAGRMAENAGVLLARRVGGGAFEPTAASTPFRHTIPVPAPALPSSPDGALVLLYHRVVRLESDPLGLCVAPEHFAQHVEVLREHSTTSLRDLRPGTVAVTFDDGYEDNLAALRALSAAAIPATLFVSTGHVEETRWFWWDELDVVLRATDVGPRPPLEIRIGDDRRAWALVDCDHREAVRGHLHGWLSAVAPQDAHAALAAIRAWSGVPESAGPPPDYRAMTVEQLTEVASLDGVEIGAHTRDHASLRMVGREHAAAQIAASRDDIERWCGVRPRSFSYPFGVPNVDYDDTIRKLVADADFDIAVTNRPGTATPEIDPLELPRLVVPDCDGDGLRRLLRTARR